MSVVRWVLVLPGAAIGGLVARVVILFLERVGMMFSGVTPDSFMWNVITQYVGGLVFGGAAVYIAARIAPSHKLPTAMAATSMLILLTGMTLIPILERRNYMELVELVVTVLAGVLVCILIRSGDLAVGEDEAAVPESVGT